MVKVGRNMWGAVLMTFYSIVYYIAPCWIRFNNIITNLKFHHVQIALTMSDIIIIIIMSDIRPKIYNK
jgi:hypothetical protein